MQDRAGQHILSTPAVLPSLSPSQKSSLLLQKVTLRRSVSNASAPCWSNASPPPVSSWPPILPALWLPSSGSWLQTPACINHKIPSVLSRLQETKTTWNRRVLPSPLQFCSVFQKPHHDPPPSNLRASSERFPGVPRSLKS